MVRKVRLDEVCEIRKGRRSQPAEGGRIPAFGAGANPTKFVASPNVTEPCIRVTAKGTVGKVYLHTEPFWQEEAAYTLVPKPELRLMYLYHVLKACQPKLEAMEEGATIPKLDLSRLSALTFTLPDLDYQDFTCAVLYQMMEGIADLIIQKDLIEKQSKQFQEDLLNDL